MPVCTRWWTTATIATSVLVQCRVITPFQLFYSFRAVFVKNQVYDYEHSIDCPGRIAMLILEQQYWRLLTTFLYFGPLSLDLLFHVFFLQRYSRLLEESSGRSPAHFSWLLVYATTLLLALSPMLSIPFLGSALSSSLVYIWSRRNPETRLSFLGLLVFTAPYLPWVLMAFSLVLHGTVPKDEICGVIAGHSMCLGNGYVLQITLTGGGSMVLFQRRVSPTTQWSSTTRSAAILAESVRASTTAGS